MRCQPDEAERYYKRAAELAPSQGAALPSVIEELPGGGMLQYVVADYKSPEGKVVEGKGVTPDTMVPETREDFAEGRDPVLDAALAALRGS